MIYFRIYWRYIKYILTEQLSGVSIHIYLLLFLFSFIAVNLIIFIYSKITGNKISKARRVLYVLLLLYAGFIFQVTFYRRLGDEKVGISLGINLGYYKGDFIAKRQLVYSILNFLFFIPWGFLLSFFYKKNVKRIFMVTLLSFLSSSIIEITQLLTHTGVFETTDLLTNTVGGFAGSVIASIFILLWNMVVNLRSNTNE